MERKELEANNPSLSEKISPMALLTRRGRKRITREQQYQPPNLDDIEKIRQHIRYILVTHDDPTNELPKAVGIIEAELEKEINPATQRQKQKYQDISKQKNRRETLIGVSGVSACVALFGGFIWGVVKLIESEASRRKNYELTHALDLNPSQPSRSGYRIRHLPTEEGATYIENPNAQKISLDPKQHIFFGESDNTFIYLEGYKGSNNEVLAKLVVEGLGSNQEWIIDTKPKKEINNQVISFDDVKTSKSTFFSVKVIKAYHYEYYGSSYWYAKSFELIPVKRISQ